MVDEYSYSWIGISQGMKGSDSSMVDEYKVYNKT